MHPASGSYVHAIASTNLILALLPLAAISSTQSRRTPTAAYQRHRSTTDHRHDECQPDNKLLETRSAPSTLLLVAMANGNARMDAR